MRRIVETLAAGVALAVLAGVAHADAPTAPQRPDAAPSVPATVTVAPSAPPRRTGCGTVACAPSSRRLTVEPWVRWWHPSVSGWTFITIGGEPGTASRIEVDDDLDLDRSDGGVWTLGAAVSLGRHRVFAEYEKLSFEGETTLDAALIFHGVTYPSGDVVDSTLDLTIWRAGYDFALVDRCDTTLRAGASAWYWAFEQRLTSAADDETRDFTHLLPVAHVELERSFGAWHGSARVAYGWIGRNRWALDLSAAAGVRLWGRVDVDAGWRWTRFAFDETTNEAELTFSGPFVSLSIDV